MPDSGALTIDKHQRHPWREINDVYQETAGLFRDIIQYSLGPNSSLWKEWKNGHISNSTIDLEELQSRTQKTKSIFRKSNKKFKITIT